MYRNAMQVEFSEDLKPILEREAENLQVQAKFVPEKEIMEGYLNRPFGNFYDFDQKERVDEVFARL